MLHSTRIGFAPEPSQKLTNRERKSPTIVEPEKRIINLSFNKLFACYKMGKFRMKEVWMDLYPVNNEKAIKDRIRK